MRPIAPRTGAPEITIEQDGFKTITGAAYQDTDGRHLVLLRWTFTAEERKQIASGEDVYVYMPSPISPHTVFCGAPDWLKVK